MQQLNIENSNDNQIQIILLDCLTIFFFFLIYLISNVSDPSRIDSLDSIHMMIHTEKKNAKILIPPELSDSLGSHPKFFKQKFITWSLVLSTNWFQI